LTTEATAESLLDQLTALFVAFDGDTVTLKLPVAPTATVKAEGLRATSATGMFFSPPLLLHATASGITASKAEVSKNFFIGEPPLGKVKCIRKYYEFFEQLFVNN
jgi:hypothetical protein